MDVGSAMQVRGFGAAMPSGGGFGDVRRAAMDAAAGALGMEQDELRSRVSGGASLSDLAAEQGVSTDDLRSAMGDAIREVAPAGVADLALARLDERLAGGGPSERPGARLSGGGFAGGGFGAGGMAGAADALAEALGMSTDELRSSIEDGTFRSRLGLTGADPGLLFDDEA